MRKIGDRDFSVFLYPGIYDVNLSSTDLNEKNIIEVINGILDKNPIFLLDDEILDAEDVVIHITKEVKNKN